jgi:hemin uptake protein HemP
MREFVMFESSSTTLPSGFGTVVHAAAVGERGARPAAAKRISSGRLLDGSNEVVIEHAGQEYRLRLTRNDKLILTK